jgi:antitoxin component of MazEF toxin-antitoxin module
LRVDEGDLVLSPVQVPSLHELLTRIKPGMQPERVDWGKPVGREAW